MPSVMRKMPEDLSLGCSLLASSQRITLLLLLASGIPSFCT